jgi:hypothetical protein
MGEQQRDLFTRRFRTVRAPDPSETQLHISVIAHLKLRARKDIGLIYFHTPNGELRDKRTAAKLKAMGVLPGVSDLQFIWKDARSNRLRVLFLELKARGKTRSDEQVAFAVRARATGCGAEVADNIDSAVAILQAYGVI